MHNTKVKDLMTSEPVFILPNSSLQQAAALMADVDCGVLPVGTKEKIIGIITDRDIVVRAIATGEDPIREKVKTHMTDKVYACSEEDWLEDAADKMRSHGVSRLVVKNRRGQVTGILSFGNILRKSASAEDVANAVKHVVRKRVA